MKLYGIENTFTWGFDWFASRDEAERMLSERPSAYLVECGVIEMTAEEIAEANL